MLRSCTYVCSQSANVRRIISDFLPTLNLRLSFSNDASSDNKPPTPKHEDPFKRTYNILKDDMKMLAKGQLKRPESDIFPSYCDVVILGGGIMGSSIAYWLKQRAPEGLNCVVVERDPMYIRASTTLSVGGVRQQFSLPENIQLSMSSLEFLRNARNHLSVLDMDPPDINFCPHGYLCLASEQGAEQLTKNYQLQIQMGAKVELMTPKQLKETFPWLSVEDIALGCCGFQNEGWFDPWSLLKAFKQKASSLGARFIKADVVGFEFRSDNEQVFEDDGGKTYPYEHIEKVTVKLDDGQYKSIKAPLIVLAAGPQSGEIGKLAKIGTGPAILKHAIPVEARKRYVYVLHCAKGPGIECPLVIDPTGAYFRREGLGGNYICGKSPLPSEEPDVTNLEVDYSFFEKQVWPLIAKRVPAFEAIKLKSAWAGYYDYNTFDQNGIIGAHPYYPNLYLATGFSGHGIQQAPAVGRAIMELMLDGDYQTIDLSRLSFERVIENTPLYEQNIF